MSQVSLLTFSVLSFISLPAAEVRGHYYLCSLWLFQCECDRGTAGGSHALDTGEKERLGGGLHTSTDGRLYRMFHDGVHCRYCQVHQGFSKDVAKWGVVKNLVGLGINFNLGSTRIKKIKNKIFAHNLILIGIFCTLEHFISTTMLIAPYCYVVELTFRLGTVWPIIVRGVFFSSSLALIQI